MNLNVAGVFQDILRAQSSQDTSKVSKSGEEAVLPNDHLDKLAFLTLFVTQLRHQDPLEPMENTEFISQLAQFSSLEQMANMNANLQNVFKEQQRTQIATQSSNLIGREVQALIEDRGIVTGKVEEILLNSETPRIVLEDGSSISFEDVIRVR